MYKYSGSDETAQPQSNKIDLDEARRFLSLLDPNAIEFCFQILDDSKRTRYARIRTGPFDELASWLVAENQRGHGVFVTVNEADGHGRQSENIKRIRCVFRELDLHRDEAAMVGLEPSVIVESSPSKFHEYFLIDPAEPLSPEEFDGVQNFLVSCDSDPNARGRARVLRLPGFLHIKGKPVRTRLIDDNGRRYTRSEIINAFPPIGRTKGSHAPIAGDLEHTQANEMFVRSLIAAIPGEDVEAREDWLRFGFALARLGDNWFDSDFNDLRLSLWDELSRRAPSYAIGDTGCTELWDGVLRDAGRDLDSKATIRTLLGAARKAGWRLETSDVALEVRDEIQATIWQVDGVSDAFDDIDFSTLEDSATAGDAEGDGAKDKPNRPRFHLESFNQIDFDPNEEWLVKRLLPMQGTAILFGASGAFKSFEAFDIGMHIALGWPWAGRKVIQAPVVYIAAEGAHGLRKRKAGFAKMHAPEIPGDVPFYLISDTPDLGTGGDDRRAIVSAIENVGIFPGAIFLDTLAVSLGAGDENGAGMVQLIANAIALSRYFKCVVILVHHTGHSDGSRERGHSSLPGALDVRILCERGEVDHCGTMTVKKLKEEEVNVTFNVALSRVVLCRDSDGDEVSTLVVDSVEEAGKEDAYSFELSGLAKILNAVAGGGLKTQRDIAAAVGTSSPTVSRILNSSEGEGCIRTDGGAFQLTPKGREALNEASGLGNLPLNDHLNVEPDLKTIQAKFMEIVEQREGDQRPVNDRPKSDDYAPKVCQAHPFNKETRFTIQDFAEAMELCFIENAIKRHKDGSDTFISGTGPVPKPSLQ